MRSRLAAERGFVVPVVLGVLAVALILVAVAAATALRTTDTASRDVWARQALQAADAGVELAVRRSNAASLDLRNVVGSGTGGLLNLNSQCVVSTGSLLGIITLGSAGWCPAVAEDLGSGEQFSYRMSSLLDARAFVSGVCGLVNLNCVYDHTLSRKVVSTGMAGPSCPAGPSCVKRRVLARLSSTSPTRTRSTSVLGVNVLGSLNLQLYNRQGDSFRECSATPPDPADPASGC